MKCPKCGYLRQTRDDDFSPPTECPACGVVYVKCGPGAAAAESPQNSSASTKKPSAVDESTLRKARERVELRLRKKIGTASPQDDQRERTLKRARILAAEGVRKRQEEWQHRQAPETDETVCPQIALDEDLDAALRETPGSKAISALADRLVFVPVAGGTAQPNGPFLDDTIRPTDPLNALSETEPELELEDTISDAPLEMDTEDLSALVEDPALEEDLQAPVIEAQEPEPVLQASVMRTPVTEEIGVTAINTRHHLKVAPRDVPAAEEADSDAGNQPQVLPLQVRTDHEIPRVKIGGLMRFFQFVAWLILISGLGGAVLSWITLKDAQAGTEVLGPLGSSDISMALLLAFAYLAIGVLGFAFFWVTALIGGQLAEIRAILLRGSQGA
jgi:hypothetical protein